jgi:hypothetical protein
MTEITGVDYAPLLNVFITDVQNTLNAKGGKYTESPIRLGRKSVILGQLELKSLRVNLTADDIAKLEELRDVACYAALAAARIMEEKGLATMPRDPAIPV